MSVLQAKRAPRGRRPKRRAATTVGLCFETLERRLALSATAAVSGPITAEAEAAPMPDFALVDANPNSLTYNHSVSPRDYLQQVSGWYFIEAT